MADLKPIIIYRYHDGPWSPNPWKVVIICLELDVPWEMRSLRSDDPDVRTKEPLVSCTPNGRMPAIEDPNTGVKLWESGAIIEYILDVYDKDNKLSYTTSPQKYEQNCWKHFQASGQGPYFGQKAWFNHLHGEKIPSAIERYDQETWRILGVIDRHLKKTGREWLVGNRVCFADLMFVPWNGILYDFLVGDDFRKEWQEEYPHCWEWHQRLFVRESVKKSREAAAKEAAAGQGVENDITVPE